jgi:hypothetical protein
MMSLFTHLTYLLSHNLLLFLLFVVVVVVNNNDINIKTHFTYTKTHRFIFHSMIRSLHRFSQSPANLQPQSLFLEPLSNIKLCSGSSRLISSKMAPFTERATLLSIPAGQRFSTAAPAIKKLTAAFGVTNFLWGTRKYSENIVEVFQGEPLSRFPHLTHNAVQPDRPPRLALHRLPLFLRCRLSQHEYPSNPPLTLPHHSIPAKNIEHNLSCLPPPGCVHQRHSLFAYRSASLHHRCPRPRYPPGGSRPVRPRLGS